MATYIETLKKQNGDQIAPRTVADAVLMSDRRTVEEAINAASIVHKTQAEWGAEEYIAKEGEMVVYDQDDSYHYSRIKIGDGVTDVAQLPFASLPSIEALDANRLINYGPDEYYFSEALYTNFRGKNRVYVERGQRVNKDDKWRGPYPMYTLTNSAGKLPNPWYWKEDWYTEYWNRNSAAIIESNPERYLDDETGKAFDKYFADCKSGAYEIPDPSDDDYPPLDSVTQRNNDGSITVPLTPTKDGDAVSKKYVDKFAETQKVLVSDVAELETNVNTINTILSTTSPHYIITPADKVLGLDKHNNAVYLSTDFAVTTVSTSTDYVFETNLLVTDTEWTGAGIQVTIFDAKGNQLGWVMLNKAGTSCIAKDSSYTNKVTFRLNDFYPTNGFMNLRIEYHNSSEPTLSVFINNVLAVMGTVADTPSATPSSARFACTKEFTGRVELSNTAFVCAESDYKIQPSDYADLSSYPTNEGLKTANIWGVSTASNNENLAVNKSHLAFATKNILADVEHTAADAVAEAVSNLGDSYVAVLESNATYDTAYVELAGNKGRATEYYITPSVTAINKDTEIVYAPGAGMFAQRYNELIPKWENDPPISNYVYDPDYTAGIIVERADHLGQASILKIGGADNVASMEKLIFLPLVSEPNGHKFVFETEVSFGGVYSGTTWCARLRFIDSNENPMQADTVTTTGVKQENNDCVIGFDANRGAAEETWFSISPSATYVAKNRVASTKTWALLRVEMIDKTFVVYINDREVYRCTRDTYLSTLDCVLGGMRLEFRSKTPGTVFYFNNTFVGTVNENFFGKVIPSIPQRLADGNINVPSTPTLDNHAASKAYVDSLLKMIEDLSRRVALLEAGGSTKPVITENNLTLENAVVENTVIAIPAAAGSVEGNNLILY